MGPYSAIPNTFKNHLKTQFRRSLLGVPSQDVHVKWVSRVHPWLGLQQIVSLTTLMRLRSRKLPKHHYLREMCKIEASGISSSLWWPKLDFLAHHFTPTNHKAHCYLLQYTNKKAAEKCGIYCLTEKVTLDGLKGAPKLLVCNWSLKKTYS